MTRSSPERMMEVQILEAVAMDIDAIAHIHAESWRDAYKGILDDSFLAGPIDADRLQLWTPRFEAAPDGQIIMKAENGSEAIGFISIYLKHDSQWGSHVDNLHVLPRYRGNKIGQRLLQAGAASIQTHCRLKEMHLWVFEANRPAIRFYERLGAKIVDRSSSLIPSAHGKQVLLLHWSDLSSIG